MSQPKAARGGAGKAKKGSKGGAEEKREDVLQAVILADSFQDRFKPLTLEKPRCLLPLANTPLIEYTLEFLAMNGVQEVFIYCGAHNEQIESYIRQSPRWNPSCPVLPFSSLDFIRVSGARSVGDFLRDLDKRSLVSGDFILVHGDLVANISLDEALRKHRARREANREAIMTMVLRGAGPQGHRTKAQAIKPVFVIEPGSGRCLHYEETDPASSDHYVNLDPAVLEHPEIEVRMDLIDCGIDICTPDVLALWTEGFDYELPRKNFLHGILKDWELNGKLIYAEVVDQGYAARASSLAAYTALTQDILGRWTYPFVPDCNISPGQSYTLARDGICAEDGVTVAPGSKVRTAAIGAGTRVGRRSTVHNSTIGRRCKIGSSVRIENSSIWDDVTIGDGATVKNSILASSVNVGGSSSVLSGSVVADGVHISDDTSLPRPLALSCLENNGTSSVVNDPSLLGTKGKGAEYVPPAADDENEDVWKLSSLYAQPQLNASTSSISTLASDETSEADDAASDAASSAFTSDFNTSRSRLSSFASDDSAAAASGFKSSFHTDAVHGLLDALRDTDSSSADFDSAKLEFMGLRLAHDANDHSVRRAVAVAFARRAAELVQPPTEAGAEGGLEPTKAADSTLRGKRGAAKFVKEVGVGGDGDVVHQAEFALALQKALASSKSLAASGRAGVLLSAMLQQLYSLDVLEEEGILAWWADKRASEGETMTAVRDKCRVLVEWLEKDDDDDDDDEDDDSE